VVVENPSKLKTYMAFSREAGSAEGAILVVAANSRQAKKMAWASNTFIRDICGSEYIDLVVRWIKSDWVVFPLADQDRLKSGVPHVIESPEYCRSCETWGCGLTQDRLCACCNEYPGDELVRLYER